MSHLLMPGLGPALRTACLAAVVCANTAIHTVALAQSPDEAPAAKETGVLSVSTPVSGAVVYVDNKEVGPAPITMTVPSGAHSVRVSADGYDPYVRKVQVKTGATARMNASLLRGGGTVEFQTNASGADVLIDGKGTSPVPVRLKSLQPGEHQWQVSAPGYEPAEGKFTLREKGNVFVYAELLSSRGLFEVTTTPDGALVLIDGEERGQTPLRLEGIEAGLHVVDITLDGYARIIRTTDTSDGAKATIEAKLSRKGGRAVIRTGSAEATVSVSGTVVGSGRRVVVPKLAKGRYPVEITRPESKTATGRLKVGSGGRSTYRTRWTAEGDRGRSKVVALPPLYERWTFWTAIGVGASGAITGGVIARQATRPIPIPDGDLVVTLP